MDLAPRTYMDPGPIDKSLLTLQPWHCSGDVWMGQDLRVLRCRRAYGSNEHAKGPDTRIVPYLQQAGFYGIAMVGFMQLDWSLISAFVERWRPETHTFHVPQGECTITLQDVAIQLGLPIDGQPVTMGSLEESWSDVCRDLLGREPPEDDLQGQRLKLSWLASWFSVVPDDADDATIQCYTRAYILRLIGGVLFPDKSSGKVHLMFLPLLREFTRAGQYSWGSACLAWLYRELCLATNPDSRDIAGPLILLQLWAWDRFPQIAPKMLYVKRVRPHDPPLACALEDGLVEDIALIEHGDDVHCNHAHVVGHEGYSEGDGHDFPPGPLACRWRGVRILTEVSKHVLKQYRFQLDNLSSKQMVWQPYTDDVVHSLPDFCFSGRDIWRAVVPLICFHIIEWHQPDRVMRQFGLQQSIPKLPKQEDHLHKIDLRGRFNFDWHQHHKRFIEIWSQRASFVVVGQPLDGPLGYHSEYMTWFRGITRRWMSPGGAVLEVVADGLEKIHRLSRPGASMIDIQQIQETCSSLFYAMDEHRHLMDVNESHPVQQVQHLPIPYVAEDRLDPPKRPKKSGLAIHRRRVEPLKTVTTCRKQLQPLKLVASTCRSSQVQPSQPLAIAEADSTHPRPSTSSFSSLLSSSAPHPPPQLKLPVSWPANRKLDLDWIQNLMACLDWSSRNLTPVQFPVVLPVNVLESLILCASEMLQKEPNCLKIDPSHPNSNSDVDQIYNIIVVGDIHGQLHDLLFLLQDAGYPSPNSIFVFNGDYVDRGAWGLETFLLLLALKVFMPYNIYLLRGSHESKFYTTTYGFEKEVLAKYGDKGKQVYQKCLKCFANLPLASIIAGCVYTTHGGLFRSEALLPSEKRPKGRKNRKIIFNCDSNSLSLGSLEELLKARRLLPDPPSEGPNFILGDVLWSDPLATPSLSSNKKRGVGLFWGPNCTEEFLEKHNLKLIIRSHEGPDAREKRDGFAGMDEGYTIDHSVKSGKLITVFSAPDYPQFQATEHRYNNKGAYVVLKPPNFDIPEFHSFEAVTPRPQVDAYYDYEGVLGSTETLDSSPLNTARKV